MLKKITFVITVSLLLLSNASAIYEEELIQLINNHVTLSRAPKNPEPDKGVVSYFTSIPGLVAESAGESVRMLGDSMRSGDGIGNYVGNSLRTLGEYGSPELKTLERELRKFWIGAKINSVGLEQVFTSTAFALCESKLLTVDLSAENGVATILKAYQDFITSWNKSSKTRGYRADDKDLLTEWFLGGIIRKRARENKPWNTSQDVLTTISLYRIDLTQLPKIKMITEETEIQDGAAKKAMDYEARFTIVQNKRLELLFNSIKSKFLYERSLLGLKPE